MTSLPPLTFHPLTTELWSDFVALFTEHGPQNGCWCMYWRAPRHQVQHQFGEGNRRAFQALVESGHITGILAYIETQPVGWCSVAPRSEYGVLDRSPTLKPVDDQPVWSIVCFFVTKSLRKRGIVQALLHAALAFAKNNGAQIVEAYPLSNAYAKTQPFDQYMGLRSTFEKFGFQEAVHRSDRRTVMRYYF